jgi:lysyl-tRNA synthetase class II
LPVAEKSGFDLQKIVNQMKVVAYSEDFDKEAEEILGATLSVSSKLKFLFDSLNHYLSSPLFVLFYANSVNPLAENRALEKDFNDKFLALANAINESELISYLVITDYYYSNRWVSGHINKFTRI